MIDNTGKGGHRTRISGSSVRVNASFDLFFLGGDGPSHPPRRNDRGTRQTYGTTSRMTLPLLAS